MGRGIVQVEYSIVAYWFVSGKRHDDIKEVLKLPEQYRIEDFAMNWEEEFFPANGYINITVSSPDIPEVKEGKALPIVMLAHAIEEGQEYHRGLQRRYRLADILIDGKSILNKGISA